MPAGDFATLTWEAAPQMPAGENATFIGEAAPQEAGRRFCDIDPLSLIFFISIASANEMHIYLRKSSSRIDVAISPAGPLLYRCVATGGGPEKMRHRSA